MNSEGKRHFKRAAFPAIFASLSDEPAPTPKATIRNETETDMPLFTLSGKALARGASSAVLLTASLLFGASAATAADCPADKVGVDVTKPGPMMPVGVADTVIASIDLKAYGFDGRALRMRRLVVQPGGIVPWHSHGERPANILVISGAITEYRSTCAVPIEHKAGDVTAESGNLSHWWKNNTRKPAVLISSDIPPPKMAADSSM
jgi:quercetin dioxygenase-like cupin family protein